MTIPRTAYGLPVAGYVVGYKFVDALVSTQAWRLWVAEQAEEFGSMALELDVADPTPGDAYSSAVAVLRKKYDDNRASTRYLFRPAPGARKFAKAAETELHIVRETFPDGQRPHHEIVGRVAFVDGAPELTAADNVPQVNEMFDELREEQDRQRLHFPSAKLRGRFSRLLDSCGGLNYDANHYFRVVLASEVRTLELLKAATDWLCEQCQSESRRERFELSILPLPDCEQGRKTLADAYEGDAEEALADVQEAVRGYYEAVDMDGCSASEERTRRLAGAINRVNVSMAALRRYESEIQTSATNVTAKIDQLRREARVLLGRDDQRPAKTLRWTKVREDLPEVAALVGDYLASLPEVYPYPRKVDGNIAWRRGEDTIAVQTDLDDPLDTEAVVTVLRRLDEAQKAQAEKLGVVTRTALTGTELVGSVQGVISILRTVFP